MAEHARARQLTLTAGARHDEDQQFGGHTSVKLAGAWQLFDATVLRANYGDGFKAPTLYELFSGTPIPSRVATREPDGWRELRSDAASGQLRMSVAVFQPR